MKVLLILIFLPLRILALSGSFNHSEISFNHTHTNYNETDFEEIRIKASDAPVCHEKSDSIGKPCEYLDGRTFVNAIIDWCYLNQGIWVQQGESNSGYLDHGYTDKHHKRLASYKVDRNGNHQITWQDCIERMILIKQDCSKGGWKNTDYGTIFAECIE
ncbi:hypothetical protein B0J11DRAFT_599532 [Dendryphion nanum]|uniref:Secreted protein n=1 Tax=Dendryphion nanum TaxID=256645 RepID=A0A9P9D0T5_9PLEO|nr:hypothetical protein B0J11DRAFT_599532 [Dendryphion nanum]